jgi:hypothetical protein
MNTAITLLPSTGLHDWKLVLQWNRHISKMPSLWSCVLHCPWRPIFKIQTYYRKPNKRHSPWHYIQTWIIFPSLPVTSHRESPGMNVRLLRSRAHNFIFILRGDAFENENFSLNLTWSTDYNGFRRGQNLIPPTTFILSSNIKIQKPVLWLQRWTYESTVGRMH